ncbi:unnamed protein product [Brugia pahangi]|uniref:Secreted protein n=1 Tax=Brugia pahangi TaxID=6280 RepID=A0A0N4T505_BRUPA|nr:unnamed protein product [Brugia pahangi]
MFTYALAVITGEARDVLMFTYARTHFNIANVGDNNSLRCSFAVGGKYIFILFEDEWDDCCYHAIASLMCVCCIPVTKLANKTLIWFDCDCGRSNLSL